MAMEVAICAAASVDEALLAQWRELAATALEPNPFFEPELVVPVARRLAHGEHDHDLVTVTDAGRLVLVLPIRRTESYRRLLGPASATATHSHSYLGTPLLARDASATAAIGAMLDELIDRDISRWLVLESAHAGGPVAAQLAEALRQRHLRAATIDRFERPVVRRQDAPAHHDALLSASRHKRLDRARRQLGEALGARLETVELLEAGVDARAAVDEFLDLEASGWKGRSGTALASVRGEAAMFRDAMQGWAADGRAQVWALRAGDTVAASACAVISAGTVFHLKIAYAERFARYSPGWLLELDLLEAFHADSRLSRLDSCTGPGESPSRRLYPHRQPMSTIVVALTRRRAVAAAAAGVVTASFAIRRRVAGPQDERPPSARSRGLDRLPPVRAVLKRVVPEPVRRSLWEVDRMARELQQRAFERRFGVSTTGHVYFESESGLAGEENAFYEGCQWLPVRRALKRLDPSPRDVFVDMGSGKGQALIIAGRLPFGRVIGIDLMDDLTRDARRNIAAARRHLKAGEVQAVTADVHEWPIPDDTSVVFLYCPFVGSVFRATIERIFESYDRRPRRLHVVYDYPWEHNWLISSGRVVLADVLPAEWPAKPWWWRTDWTIPVYRVVGEGEGGPGAPRLRRRLFRPQRAIERWSGPNDQRFELERGGRVVATSVP